MGEVALSYFSSAFQRAYLFNAAWGASLLPTHNHRGVPGNFLHGVVNALVADPRKNGAAGLDVVVARPDGFMPGAATRWRSSPPARSYDLSRTATLSNPRRRRGTAATMFASGLRQPHQEQHHPGARRKLDGGHLVIARGAFAGQGIVLLTPRGGDARPRRSKARTGGARVTEEGRCWQIVAGTKVEFIFPFRDIESRSRDTVIAPSLNVTPP